MAVERPDIDPILLEFYGERGLPNMAYETNELLGMAAKKKVRGKYHRFGLKFSYAANRSHTAGTALAKENAPQYEDFQVPTIEDYNAISIREKEIADCEDEGAFAELVQEVVEDVNQSLTNNLGSGVFGRRGGNVARVASTVFTATDITITLRSDVNRLEKDMTVLFSTSDGLSGVIKPGSLKIDNVDRDTGVVTFTQVANVGVPTIATSDYIFPAGDFGKALAGLPDWVPDTTVGLTTAFYAALRSKDAVRLAGSRHDATGQSIEAAIRSVATKIKRNGGMPKVAVLSDTTFNELVTELEGKTTYNKPTRKSPDADIGYVGVTINAGKGNIDVFCDRSCQDDHTYVGNLDEKSFRLIYSSEKPVAITTRDGNMLSRETSDFAFEIRAKSFSNWEVRRPIDWGVGFNLPVAA